MTNVFSKRVASDGWSGHPSGRSPYSCHRGPPLYLFALVHACAFAFDDAPKMRQKKERIVTDVFLLFIP